MIIEFLNEPFDHIIITDTFDEVEYDAVVAELLFLQTNMSPPEHTGAAARGGIALKSGGGIMLQEFYKNIQQSNVQKYTRKICRNSNVWEAIAKNKSEMYYGLYTHLKNDSILVQYYGDGDFYNPHEDACVFSAVTVLHDDPKKFSGGDLVFPDFGYNPTLRNNQTIIFPSILTHAVEPLRVEEGSSGLCGRFSITNFMGFL